jgi:hypothetical protein
MRFALLLILAALFAPAAAIAQAATPTSPETTAAPAARTRGGDITKEEYVERARRAAERRFDKMDTNHDGVLTADERRAAREQRGQRRSTQPAQ